MTGAERLLRAGVLTVLAVSVAGAAGAWAVAVAPETGAELGLPDAGTLTDAMLPATRVIRDFAMATAIGALVLAAFVVSPGSARLGISATGMEACVRVARRACLAWVVSGLAVLVFMYSELVGRPVGAVEGAEFNYFLTSFPLSRALLFNILAAVLIPLILAVGHVRMFRGLAVLLALAATWPLATIGHAAGAANHDHAVNMQAFHVVGISVWFGGLLTLLVTWRELEAQRVAVLQRFSTIAGWSFVVVALSGVVAAVIRVETWSNLSSSYGALVLAKAGLLTVLGVIGWQHRRFLVSRTATGGGWAPFWRLAAGEVVVMSVALGAGVALGNTPPPQDSDRRLTAAESLLGYPLPGPLQLSSWVTAWRIDSLWVPISVLAIGLYIAWVVRLKRRGDSWPLGRTVAWVAGWLSVIWATSAAPGVYGDVLFSVHMIQHMTIATTSPILMVLGAPVTLALRALAPRSDGSSGPREWLLYVVHSRPARLFGNAIFAAGLFVVGLIVFYYTGLFEYSLRSHTAHNLMLVHFLGSGYLFASVICGTDPGIRRPPYPLRILIVMVTFGFHALFAISLMNASELLAGNWFPSLGRTWGASPLEDQRTGASIGWLLGDYPLAILAGALIWGWVRDDTREARRLDRQADRDGDAATRAYNEYLHGISTLPGRVRARTDQPRRSTSNPDVPPADPGDESPRIHQESP